MIDAAGVAPVPRALRELASLPARRAVAVIDPDICGDDVPAPAVPPPPDVDSEPDVEVEVEPAAASTDAGIVGDGPPAPDWPVELDGVPLRQVAGRSDHSWHYHPRLLVVCPNRDHRKCSKS